MILHVAVGVIVNAEHQILVAQRRSGVDHEGLWEFPGGKVEAGETVYAALCRELKEEVHLDVVAATPLIQVSHDYDQYSVLLDTWLVDQFSGESCGAEGQIIRWVDFSSLRHLAMPAANNEIINALCRIKHDNNIVRT